MSEIREDPVTGRSVIIAENRAGRPSDFERPGMRRIAASCPFCAGNEEETPAAMATYRREETSQNQWDVRVVPNKYPAIQVALATHSTADLRESKETYGVHEIVVEASQHCATITDLSVDHVGLILRAYRDRMLELSKQEQLSYALLFKNSGPTAGASLEHVHSQLIGLPIVPKDVACEVDRAREHLESTGKCVVCKLIDRELGDNDRMVEQSTDFVAYCPFASRFAHEVWIVPRRHAGRFETTGDDQLAGLARMVRDVLKRVEFSLNDISYNLLIRNPPFDTFHDDYYHWRIEILPRLSSIAGFELGCECFINPVSPENAARRLREANS